MRQTAIEWLVETVEKNRHKPIKELFVYIRQAKEMEKEQMEKTWVAGLYCETGDRQAFIDYYNENYKSE
jgi:phenylalanyl-tRNA synthetase beta subunit